ncbi:MAG: hypothetical protein QXI39_00330 [Candidatus Bathyarchaeia archaeon]
MEREKIRTIIEVDRTLWAEVRKEAFVQKKTVSEVLEEAIRKAYQKP